MLLTYIYKMGFMAVSLAGKGERLLSKSTQIVLDGQSHCFYFFFNDCQDILLQLQCLHPVINDTTVNDIDSLNAQGVCSLHFHFLILYQHQVFSLSQHCAASEFTTVNPLHFLFFQSV